MRILLLMAGMFCSAQLVGCNHEIQNLDCTPGSTQCSDTGNLETCNQTGDAWEQTEVCKDGCQDGACVSIESCNNLEDDDGDMLIDCADGDCAQEPHCQPDPAECSNWTAEHPEWIFCDDFESTDPLVGEGRYFEYDDDEGDCIVQDGVGLGQSRGLRIKWEPAEVGAGGIKLGFGRNPQAYMNKGIRPTEDFREIYYRMYLKNQAGWQGSPAKLSRATVFSSASDWSQAMIAHLWSHEEYLIVDPASCVEGSQVKCTRYNDFDNLDWLGIQVGLTPIFATGNADVWYCIEAHVVLNDPGERNGVQEFWIDGQLEARADELDFVGSYQDYAINAVFFENYWNERSPIEQERYFDNIVVSTQPIGCLP